MSSRRVPAWLAAPESTVFRKLPRSELVALATSSPFIIISAWGIVPLKVVASSFSSVPKAITNCRSQVWRCRSDSSQPEPPAL